MTEAQRVVQHEEKLPGWDMKSKDDPSQNTHLWIVLEAIAMVGALKDPDPRAGAARVLTGFAETQSGQLNQGIWNADNASPWNDFIYAYHFYDPETNTNYYPCLGTSEDLCRETARRWGSRCFNDSLQLYAQQGHDPEAAYQLGLSLHFLTDLGQPMHAANFTTGSFPPGYHTSFEAYAITWTNDHNPQRLQYEQTIESDSFDGFIEKAAGLSKQRTRVILSQGAENAWLYGGGTDNEDWRMLCDPQIDGALQDIRKVTAQYLLMWVQQAIAMRPTRTWAISDVTKSAGSHIAENGGLAAVSWGDREQVFFLDGSKHVNVVTRHADNPWQPLDLTQHTDAPLPAGPLLVGSTLSGADLNRGTLAAFLDGQSHVRALLQPPGSDWELHDLTQEAGAVPARPGLLAAYATGYVATEQIAWVDPSGHLHALTRVRGGAWTDVDLTAQTSGPPWDGTALAGFAWDDPHLHGIMYLDAGGHVHEVGAYQTGETPWSGAWDADLTVIADAPAAVGGLIGATGWSGGYESSKQVSYFGTDGHIHELSCTVQGPWTWTDLTKAANAPVVAVTALTEFEWTKDQSKHVAYADRDGHVHDLSLGASGRWTYVDLNELLKAPQAAGNALAGFAHDVDVPQRMGVCYVDGYGHVQAFTAVPSSSGTTKA